MSRQPFDPVSLNIYWSQLISRIDEAAAAFRRTSFSTLVRESNDFAVILTDRHGRSIGQSSLSIPSFIGTLPGTVKTFIERFPLRSLAPGDFLVTNDPWLATGHLYDVSGAMPLFHRGRIVGFAAVASHVPDIGGRIWGTSAREIFEEGLQIPPLKLLRAGEPDPGVVAMIERNVRVPDLTLGDLWGQVSACRMLEAGLATFLDETGVNLDALGAQLRQRAERAMRSAIEAVPDGVYRHAVHQDGFDGEAIEVRCALTVAGSEIDIDFAGSSPQQSRAVNVVPSYSLAYSCYAVKCMLEPEVPNNEGSFQPIRTRAPLGSVLNPRFPAATGARHIIGHMVVPAVMGALAQAAPARARAEGSFSAILTLNGEHRGRRYHAISFMCSGQGATREADGHSTLAFPTNVGNSPIEVMEQLAPIRVHHRRRRRGSGGAGRHRGGDGGSLAFEFVGDSPGIVSFVVRSRDQAPRGADGGGSGRPARLMVNGRPVESGVDHLIRPGDQVLMETAGGGGFGALTPPGRGARRPQRRR
jgi:N-methylhydantoinase B